MKPLSLNMDKYIKVADDGNTSTLRQHGTGHEITIAHKALPREQRSFLKALPLYADSNESSSAPIKPPTESQSRGLNAQGQGYAKGAAGGSVAEALRGKSKGSGHRPLAEAFEKRANYASGDDVSPLNSGNLNEQIEQPRAEAKQAAIDEARAQQDPMTNYYRDAAPAPVVPEASNDAAPPPPPSAPPSTTSNDQADTGEEEEPDIGEPGAAQPITPPVSSPVSQQPGGAPSPISGQPSPPAPVQTLADNPDQPGYVPPSPTGNPTSLSIPGGVGEQIVGTELAAATQAELQKRSAPFLKSAAEGERAAADIIQNRVTSEGNELALLEKERNDPKNKTVGDEHYWQNHSKIATGLGLILAGFNPTNRPNAALDFLNKSIERDTDDQRKQIGQRNDLLSHYVQQFPNVEHAIEFVNSAKKNAAATDMERNATQLADPIARAKQLQLAGQLRQSGGQTLLPYTFAGGVSDALNHGHNLTGRLANLEANPQTKPLADHIKAVTLVGEGNFQNPPPPAIMADITAKKKAMQASQYLRNYIQTNSKAGVLSPLARGPAETLAGELHGMYRQAMGASTAEGESAQIGKIIGPDPGSFLQVVQNNPKLQKLEESFQNGIDSYKGTYGFNPDPAGVQQQQKTQAAAQAGPKEGQTFVDAKGRNRKYARGANGQLGSVPNE